MAIRSVPIGRVLRVVVDSLLDRTTTDCNCAVDSVRRYSSSITLSAHRVVYDSQVFAEQSRGGVSRYFLNLASALSTYSDWEPLVALGWHVQGNLAGHLTSWGPQLKLGPTSRAFRLRRGINRLAMHRKPPVDDGETLYHPTWYHVPTILAWKHLPITVTIHDLIPETWPAVTDARQLADRRKVLAMSNSVVCVSQSTLTDLAIHYPETARKATVSLPGLPELPVGRPNLPDQKPYLLHVGKRGAYKDFITVLRGLALLSDISLVIVGGGTLSSHEREMIAELNLSNRVVAEGSVEDQRLADLLVGAVALVSASQAEGFGLPPLEALAQGIPSVLTDIPAYREIHGRWATFFPPKDPRGLAEAVESVSRGGHPPLPSRDEVRRSFSWAETVRSTVGSYEMALG